MTNIYIADTAIKYRAEIKGIYEMIELDKTSPAKMKGFDFAAINIQDRFNIVRFTREQIAEIYSGEQYAIELEEIEKCKELIDDFVNEYQAWLIDIPEDWIMAYLVVDMGDPQKGHDIRNCDFIPSVIIKVTPAQLAAIEAGSKYIFTDDTALINTIKEMMG